MPQDQFEIMGMLLLKLLFVSRYYFAMQSPYDMLSHRIDYRR